MLQDCGKLEWYERIGLLYWGMKAVQCPSIMQPQILGD